MGHKMFKKIILTILSVFIVASISYADTISAEIDKTADWSDGQRLYRVHLYFKSSAGADPAEFNLSTYLAKGQTNIVISRCKPGLR